MTKARGFQLLPAPSPGEYAALKRDIAAHGVAVPVEVDEDGTTLDGHTRIKIVTELRAEGVKVPDYPRVVRRFKTREEKIGHVLALNLARRHLSRPQRRDLVATLPRERWSHRRIADVLGIDEATVRRDLQGAANAAPERVRGKDGRRYPATRPKGTRRSWPAPLAKRRVRARHFVCSPTTRRHACLRSGGLRPRHAKCR
jgi:ParB-like chromosome segregation protein Spo0J